MSIWKRLDQKFAIKSCAKEDKELSELQGCRNFFPPLCFFIFLAFEFISHRMSPEGIAADPRLRLLPYRYWIAVAGLLMLITAQIMIFKLLKKRRDQDSYGD